MDPIANLFRLYRYQMDPHFVTDAVEAAVGVYDRDFLSALIRTLNPLWWAWKLVGWLASLPFALIGAAGFNRAAAEGSVIGKLFKFIAEISILILTLLQIDQLVFAGKYLVLIKANLPT
ncbi:hypothetical protein HJA_09199 [Hyphomonas jannaschiana VP2]|uniref:Uncharacterized protein n=2 Tax=Hyphomonas jannaschiana TaxID=86 RepID=A0A059FDF9_9PROT|nr:hypothetical protein HJA_09199 [Hyphomonas jannaschiana VP2]